MGKIIIMTDSASDISEKEEKELGIKILPFPVVIGGKSYLSRVDFDNEGFYKLMAENDDLPKTSQITSSARCIRSWWSRVTRILYM